MARISSANLTASFGSQVEGLDLSQPLSAEASQSLRDLFCRRKLLLIRQGPMTAEQQIALMSAIGPVIVENPNGSLSSRVSNLEIALVQSVAKLPFHSDYQFTPEGPLDAVSLYAEITENGEPTTFVNMIAAVDRLPPSLRARMEDLRVVQMADWSRTASDDGRHRLSNRSPGAPDSQYPHCSQPMIEVHPGTGERYVNVSQRMTSHVEGWSDAASDGLFAEIESYVYVPENSYRHEWVTDDLVIWDNRALQHGREALAQAARRSLRRVAVNSVDVPTMMRTSRPDPVKFPGVQWWPHDQPVAEPAANTRGHSVAPP